MFTVYHYKFLLTAVSILETVSLQIWSCILVLYIFVASHECYITTYVHIPITTYIFVAHLLQLCVIMINWFAKNCVILDVYQILIYQIAFCINSHGNFMNCFHYKYESMKSDNDTEATVTNRYQYDSMSHCSFTHVQWLQVITILE